VYKQQIKTINTQQIEAGGSIDLDEIDAEELYGNHSTEKLTKPQLAEDAHDKSSL